MDALKPLSESAFPHTHTIFVEQCGKAQFLVPKTNPITLDDGHRKKDAAVLQQSRKGEYLKVQTVDLLMGVCYTFFNKSE